MQVLSWNVARSGNRITKQVEWIESLGELPEILLLQEVNLHRKDDWEEMILDRLSYENIVDTIDWGNELDNSNGHLTATRTDCELTQKPINGESDPGAEIAADTFGTEYPEKILVAECTIGNTEIECWNVRAVPGRSYPEEKRAIFEYIYNQIESRPDKVRLLGGDLNTPKRELSDGQPVTYGYNRSEDLQRKAMSAELNILKGLGHFGMVDVFRSLHGYGEIDQNDVSHNRRRIDHLFASESLSPTECWYPPVEDVPSDHAPIIAKFED